MYAPYLPYLYIAVFFATGYLFFRFVIPYIMPFVIAAVIAFIIDPVVTYLERSWGVPRGVGAGVALVVLIAALAGLIFLLVSRLVAELDAISSIVPVYYRQVETAIESILEGVIRLPDPIRAAIEGQAARGIVAIQGILATIVDWARALPRTIAGTVIAFLASYFLSKDKDLIGAFLLEIMPGRWRKGLIRAKADLVVSTLGFVQAEAFLIGLSTLISITGLHIIGAKYALAVGLFIGFVDVMPVVGPSAVYWPWIIYNVATGNFLFAVKLALVFAVSSLTRSTLEPRVVGARIGLHPLATLFSLYLGVRLLGVVGLIVGPLVAIFLKSAINSGLIPFPSREGD
ncbi:MAG TPA: sporulation integral membrane protein YtvI [Clostridia bacterium]|nr:sporulation integral membrane protein YtvI [Clostridia bacterium]